MRAEQIKLDICYEELPVVMIGDGAGFVYRALGAATSLHRRISHFAPFPMCGFPADAHEMTRAWNLALSAASAGLHSPQSYLIGP